MAGEQLVPDRQWSVGVDILDCHDRFHRVHDAEIGDRGDVDADVVAGDDASGLNRDRDDAQRDSGQAIDEGE